MLASELMDDPGFSSISFAISCWRTVCYPLGPGFVSDTFFYGSLFGKVFEYLHEPLKREFCCLPSSDNKLIAEIPLNLRWRGSYWVILNNPYLLLYCEHADFFCFSFVFICWCFYSAVVIPSLDCVGRCSNFQYLGYENSNHFSSSLTLTRWKLNFTFAK